MTRFDFTYTFRWSETRDQVLKSGLWIEDPRLRNSDLQEALQDWYESFKGTAIPDNAQGKLRITCHTTKRKAKT